MENIEFCYKKYIETRMDTILYMYKRNSEILEEQKKIIYDNFVLSAELTAKQYKLTINKVYIDRIIDFYCAGLDIKPQAGHLYFKQEKSENMYDEKSQLMSLMTIKGYIYIIEKLGYRPNVQIIYENDVVKNFNIGDMSEIDHTPSFKNAGDPVACYCVLYDKKDKIKYKEYTSHQDINKIKECSTLKDDEDGPWNKFFEEMWKKVTIKRILKRMNIGDNEFLLRSIDHDNQEFDFYGNAYTFINNAASNIENAMINEDYQNIITIENDFTKKKEKVRN